MKMKKWLQTVLFCLLLLAVLPASAAAAEVTASGTGEDGLNWSLTDDGTLTISGSAGSFDSDTVTLRHIVGTTGWDENYNAADGKWNGYVLTRWGRLFAEDSQLLSRAAITEKKGKFTFFITLAASEEDTTVYFACYSIRRMTALDADTVCAQSANRTLEYTVSSLRPKTAKLFFTRADNSCIPLAKEVCTMLRIAD